MALYFGTILSSPEQINHDMFTLCAIKKSLNDFIIIKRHSVGKRTCIILIKNAPFLKWLACGRI